MEQKMEQESVKEALRRSCENGSEGAGHGEMGGGEVTALCARQRHTSVKSLAEKTLFSTGAPFVLRNHHKHKKTWSE